VKKASLGYELDKNLPVYRRPEPANRRRISGLLSALLTKKEGRDGLLPDPNKGSNQQQEVKISNKRSKADSTVGNI